MLQVMQDINSFIFLEFESYGYIHTIVLARRNFTNFDILRNALEIIFTNSQCFFIKGINTDFKFH